MHTKRMICMIFEIICLILQKTILQFSLFQNSNFWVFLNFWLKNTKITKVDQKAAKIINLPFYLSHFIKKNPLFDVDLFSRTFDMESELVWFGLV